MVWVKLTDRHPQEAHKARLSPQARCLHIDALCYLMANDNETQRITRDDLHYFSTQRNPEEYTPELEKVGWWVPQDQDMWLIDHDMGVQRTNEQIVTDRAATQRRVAKHRGSSTPGNAVTPGVGNTPPVPVPVPTGTPNGVPVQTQTQRPLVRDLAGRAQGSEPLREDVEQLCVYLADCVEANGFTRPRITQTWRRDMRLLIDRDGHTADKVRVAITWCQRDHFWFKNIRSPAKLREKYERMQMDCTDKHRPQNQGETPPLTRRQAQSDDMFAQARLRALARMEAAEVSA